MPSGTFISPVGLGPPEHDVRVRPYQQRWELRIDGLTRPLVDWFFSRERAIHGALRRAREFGADSIIIEDGQHGIAEVLPLHDIHAPRRVA